MELHKLIIRCFFFRQVAADPGLFAGNRNEIDLIEKKTH